MWKQIKSQEFFPSSEKIVMEEIAVILQSSEDQLKIFSEQYVPNAKQAEMEQILDTAPKSQIQTILMYGSPGSGKTMGAIARGIRDLNLYPGSEGAVFRRTYSEIFGNLLEPIEAFLRRYSIAYHRTLTPFPAIRFPNGSVLHLRSTEKSNQTDDGKADTLGGLELSWALIDELDSTRPEFFTTLRSSRMRQKFFPNNYIFGVCNPSSEDSWVYRRFEDLLKLGPGTYSDPSRNGVHAIHCPVDVNRANLPEGYIETMEEDLSRSPALYRKFRLGLFGPAIQGTPLFGETFERKWHVAPASLKVLRDVPIWRSWDFGWRRPAVVLAQEDPETGQIRWLRSTLGHHELLHKFARRMIHRHKNLYPGAKFIDFCDIEGRKKNPYSEKTQIQILQSFRLNPMATYSLVPFGLNLMADQLTRTVGRSTPAMLFDPVGAAELADAFEFGYTQDMNTARDEIVPVKDGYYEHIMDAARYILVNVREMEARSAPKISPERRNWKAVSPNKGAYVVQTRDQLRELRPGSSGKGSRLRARYNFGGGKT